MKQPIRSDETALMVWWNSIGLMGRVRAMSDFGDPGCQVAAIPLASTPWSMLNEEARAAADAAYTRQKEMN